MRKMKESIYITSDGTLRRKDNTLCFQFKDQRKIYIPVYLVKDIYMFGNFEINSKLLEFLSKNGIVLFYFNYYANLAGHFCPNKLSSVNTFLLKQAQIYNKHERRISLAKLFVIGAIKNELKTLSYYIERRINLNKQKIMLLENIKKIEDEENMYKIMNIEGYSKMVYFSCFKNIINNDNFRFIKRTKRPPKDRINAIISFYNSLLYSQILKYLYLSKLDPRIGFLHSSVNRQFSLHLDIAEMFKPIIVDRLIFNLIRKNILIHEHFENKNEGVFLNNKGRIITIEYFDDKLNETVKINERKMSYRTLIKTEILKLEKSIKYNKKYNPIILDV